MRALEYIGAQVTVASVLRTRDGQGNMQVQRDLMEKSAQEVARLTRENHAHRWDAWVTYHNYYKAPDLIGPQVARYLGIPYLQVECSRARKRLVGPWAGFANASEAAADAAEVIFYLTQQDAQALYQEAPADQHLIHLRPFLNQTDLPPTSDLNGPILSVAMMRHGDKLQSYRIVAETLALMPQDAWRLHIAGDGPARAQVEALMAPFGAAVTFLGALDKPAMQAAYQSASVLFWPGVNEAFGLTYLEAQAAGVPVVAQDRPGVRDVLAPGAYPSVSDGAPALAKQLMVYLNADDLRQDAGQSARNHIAERHLLPDAALTLQRGLALSGLSF
jgi:glycosyltransferase involved in cell wall biosynthesis